MVRIRQPDSFEDFRGKCCARWIIIIAGTRHRGACTGCRRGKHDQEDGLRGRPPAATPVITTQGKVPMRWHALPQVNSPSKPQGSDLYDGTTQNQLIPPRSQLSQPATRYSLSIREI